MNFKKTYLSTGDIALIAGRGIIEAGSALWYFFPVADYGRFFMEKRTVKRRIFLSNAWMVVVTLFIFLMINLFVIKFYAESFVLSFF